jgi:hypothetical protein
MSEKQFFITEQIINQYAQHLKLEERAAATVEKYIRDIRAFADFLEGSRYFQTGGRFGTWKSEHNPHLSQGK